jgi:hypothetical protein
LHLLEDVIQHEDRITDSDFRMHYLAARTGHSEKFLARKGLFDEIDLLRRAVDHQRGRYGMVSIRNSLYCHVPTPFYVRSDFNGLKSDSALAIGQFSNKLRDGDQ